MAFHVGQKVVCVNGDFPWSPKRGQRNRPSSGTIYTIRDIYIEHFAKEGEKAALLLEEIRNEPLDWKTLGFHEAGFSASRFRPVVERKTDISALTALLNPANHKKLEDVS